jgi:hypothetical protein
MSTPTKQLAERVTRARAVLAEHATLTGPSKAATIQALNELLRSPEAELVLHEATAHADKTAAAARATFIPVLERAHHKLTQLRPSHTGAMGMSIDRDLVEINTALALAREGQK